MFSPVNGDLQLVDTSLPLLPVQNNGKIDLTFIYIYSKNIWHKSMNCLY